MLAAPPPSRLLAAQRAPRASSSRRRIAVSAKWVLVPTGSGDTAHLELPPGVAFMRPKAIELGSDKLVVGRKLSATVNAALEVPTVSSTHAMVDCVGGAYYVTDLASTNGTFVDGEELAPGTPTRLAGGSEVVFGDDAVCRFTLTETT